MSNLLSRIAGAPITWGVDPSPGWGYQMERDRVLSEMEKSSLSATELGPDGWLPTNSDQLNDLLGTHNLRVVGGFVPATLYRPDLVEEQLAYVDRASRTLAQSGSEVMVLGPSAAEPGYEHSVNMSDDEWKVFIQNVNQVMRITDTNGVVAALHPHWGLAIERQEHVERLLESCDVQLCLDTGHLALAEADPVVIARLSTGRVRHVHLKDLDDGLAERVRRGDLGFREAVGQGMFRPLGEGDVDIAGFIRHLESAGYQGWYVLEQDVVLDEEPAPGQGPVSDARTSVAFLEELARDL